MPFHQVVLHEFVSEAADGAAIWRAVQDVWPDAVALDYSPFNDLVDWPAAKAAWERGDREGLDRWLVPPEARRPPPARDIGDETRRHFKILTAPPVLTAEVIANATELSELERLLPGLQLHYERGLHYRLDPAANSASPLGMTAPTRSSDQDVLSLAAGAFSASWRTDDPGTRSDVRRFFRRLKKLATNKLLEIDERTLAVVRRVEKGGWMWACPAALEWSRGHPRNVLQRRWKPLDWQAPAR